MYVCMSENLYPARLKRKRHSRAAVMRPITADAPVSDVRHQHRSYTAYVPQVEYLALPMDLEACVSHLNTAKYVRKKDITVCTK